MTTSRRAAIRVESRAEAFPRIHATLTSVLPAWLPESVRHRLAICLGEAFQNAVVHAWGHEDGWVEVRVALDDERVVIDVVDGGSGMTDADRRRLATAELPDLARTPLSALPEGGYGFGILRSVMDEIEYTSRRGRNRLRMTKRIADAAEPAPLDPV
ncbi:MAG: ATP-binding protein [Gemmatimonadetes bacterium]|nr:ATP-binding protein [Gemmatimonadota bacterium]